METNKTKYIKIDWPESQFVEENIDNYFHIHDSQSIFVEEKTYSQLIKETKFKEFFINIKRGEYIFVITSDGTKWLAIFDTLENKMIKSYINFDIINNKTYSKPSKDISYYLCDLREIIFIRKANNVEIELLNNRFNLKKDNKFNINNLKSFDEVLCRDESDKYWKINFYSHYDKSSEFPFVCMYSQFKECIPYNDETKHLLGTNNSISDKV